MQESSNTIRDLVIIDIERWRGKTEWLYAAKGYLVGTENLIYDTFWRYDGEQHRRVIEDLKQSHHIVDESEILFRATSYGEEKKIEIAPDCDEALVLDRFLKAFQLKTNNYNKAKLAPFSLCYRGRVILNLRDLLSKKPVNN